MSGEYEEGLDSTHTTAISAVQAAYNIRLISKEISISQGPFMLFWNIRFKEEIVCCLKSSFKTFDRFDSSSCEARNL